MKIKNLFLVSVLCLFGKQVVAQEFNYSVGTNSFNGNNQPKGTTAVGTNAGRYNNPDSNPSPTFSYGAYNTYLGLNAGQGFQGNNTAYSNVCIGKDAGLSLTSGSFNTYVGNGTGGNLKTSSSNVFLGYLAGRGVLTSTKNANSNVIIGDEAGIANEGFSNVYIGSRVSHDFGGATFANRNTFIGANCGEFMRSDGNFNTFIGWVRLPEQLSVTGNSQVLAQPGYDTKQTIILADGFGSTASGGNQRLYIHSNGFAGIGLGNNVIPKSMLEIKGFSSGAQQTPSPSGLRLTNLPNTAASTTNTTDKVLSVNAAGDVILVDDKQAVGGVGVVALCNTQNYVTKFSGVSNQITCSSIYDNGTSVGIGTSSNFGYTYAAGDDAIGTVPLAGTVKLDIAGITRSTGFYAMSDKKFKKDIKTINAPLEKIMALEGKTYNWRKDEFKDKNFGSELQYGLIAQEVQKILPSLVIESDKGDLAMNYIGIIPVLIEAMKEQQTQINELKAQISNNFKTQNQDLLQFENTKIINVSPNPSSDVILVSLNIEKAVTSANLQVHDLNGTLLSSLNLKERDTNIIKSLQKDNFGSGIYIVSLIVNGKSIDTKKIIFN